ncbi:MAG: hypothetical protein ABI885_11165 [Gammaproteobacteria bacterium]
MGGPSKQNLEELRARARERVEQHQLPIARPARTWGGRGTGLACSLCDAPILPSETEMELEFEGAPTALLRFHLQCQSVWEAARQVPKPMGWTPVGHELPPLHTIVEGRLTLGESRSIILNIMRVCDGETGPVVWLNATTNSPLPETWLPLEWRLVGQGVGPAVSPATVPSTRRA